MKNDSLNTFKHKIRVRVCGILRSPKGILMIKHENLSNKPVWLPPGGGIVFGETIETALIREFKEETNLTITVTQFLGINEHIANDLHAIELFYEVNYQNGELRLGSDPELTPDQQLIKEIAYLPEEECKKLIPINF